jgi:hypothetical protein
VVLVHGIQVRNRKANAWYEAFVDVHTGKFISSIDLVSKSAVTSSPFSNSELSIEFFLYTNKTFKKDLSS